MPIEANKPPPIVCDHQGCQRKGWWIEKNLKGEPMFCFWTRHDGKKHRVRITAEQFHAAINNEG